LSKIPPISEIITERRIIVYKSRVDPTIVKLTAEKMKHKLFSKFVSKNKSEDIRVVSVDKYYEPYVLIDAKYKIQYSKTKVYNLDVDDETEEVKISGKTYRPKIDPELSESSGESKKIIKLEAQMCGSYQDKIYLVLDKEGKEIPHDQVPVAPSEDQPAKILNEFSKKTPKVHTSSKKELEMVKSRIVKRPSNMNKIEEEIFHVSEHAIIYSPIYEITFRNTKNGEEKLIKIDGVTAKIIA
jgi:hypothetical protein